MSESFQCAKGHRWELPLAGDAATTSVEVKCPICGQVGQPLPHTVGESPDTSESETLPPIMPSIPGYEILERLGEGGMGQVYKARHVRLDRIVALKVIHPDYLSNPDAVRRFHREARAAARLAHPHLVTVYDVDEVGGTHFLAMEYVDGTDLGRWVKTRGVMPADRACEYVRQAALGLQHIHERGLVHRDIKPTNLFLTSSETLVKVLDLGLARLNQPGPRDQISAELTQPGAVMGTPAFLAPEQARDSRRVDIRSDIYSLGCTFYYLLTGRVPFPGIGLAEIVVQHQLDEPEPVEKLRSDISPHVTAIVRKMMAKKPEERYQTPAEVALALSPFCRPTMVNRTATAAAADVPAIGAPSLQSQILAEFPPAISASPASSQLNDPTALCGGREMIVSRLRAPALLLVVTGVLNWLALTVIALILAFSLDARFRQQYTWPVTVGLGALFVASAVIIFGAFKMKNAESYRWALASAIAAMLIGPGNIIGLPIGIWALSELLRTGHREAFGTLLPTLNRPSLIQPAAKGERRLRPILLGCGILVLGSLLCAGGMAWLWMLPVKPGTVAEAEKHNQRALARDPSEYDSAITDLTEAIRLAPDKAEYFGNRGRRYILRGKDKNTPEDFDQAIADLTEAIRLAPNDASLRNHRGWAYLNKEDWEKALADVEEAVLLNPDDATCLSNRGWAYKLKGDYAAAIKDLNRAIDLFRGPPSATVLGGDVYFRQQFNLAAMARAYLTRSEIYAKKGDKIQSDADYAEAIRRDPSLPKDKK